MREIDTIDPSMKQINRETLIGWVVFYYENGEVTKYTSDLHDWASLPSKGVMCLFRIYQAGYKEQVTGVDFYCPYQLMDVADVRPWIKYGVYVDDYLYNNFVAPVIFNDPTNR